MATAGTVIGGRFRVDHLLGSGGMGVVVAATHLELGHRVAVKYLRDDMARNPSVVERFLREARAAVQLRTEHVCRVFDVGRTDTGAPYMVMELLEGNDLGRALATGPLPVTIAVEYVMQACVAVAEAHAAGIIHRDLKPSNLIITRRPGGGPLVKVLDFGIAKAMTEAGAKLTMSQSMLGSPGYISPEQLQSARDVDVRTDIWALGATLYQLVSGRLPFYAATATAMAVRIMTQPPDPLDVDPALRAVIMRCLEKAPDQRHRDVAALVRELAPFGGPTARAITATVAELLHGPIAPASPSTPSPFAMTGPASTASVAGQRMATAVPSIMGTSAGPRGTTTHDLLVGTSSGPRGATTHDRVARIRRRAWWWITAPLVVLASVSTALICGERDATTPAQGSAAAIIADDRAAARVPSEVGSADPSPLAPADAGGPGSPAPPPDSGRTIAWPTETRPKDARSSAAPPPVASARDAASARGSGAPARGSGAPARGSAAPARGSAAPARGSAAHAATATASDGGHESSKPAVGRAVADTAREAKATCLESAADTPFNTAMCWCAKKDKARAQAAYARLSGFKRASVRTWCAARGVEL